jgi:hypothetical protein
MRLHVKNRDELTAQIADFIARGGKIQTEDQQTVTKRLRKATSLASRHIRQYNKLGRRVVK